MGEFGELVADHQRRAMEVELHVADAA